LFTAPAGGKSNRESYTLMTTNLQNSFAAPVERAEFFRLDVSRKLDAKRRAEWGQFLTPPAVAHFMASLFQPTSEPVRLLDAGAGVGALSAAFVAEVCRWQSPPATLSVIAYEIDAALADYLRDTLESCRVECERVGINFTAEVRRHDFIESSAKQISAGLSEGREAYTHAILNPPYRKINSGSEARRLLRSVGVETSNLYTAFLSLVTRLLESAGELVAITPRSFCNGPYFKSFRREFLAAMNFRRVHVFETRNLTFDDDDVLQENIIFHAVKQAGGGDRVLVSTSTHVDDEVVTIRDVPAEQFIRPDDPDAFIRIVPDELGYRVAARMGLFTATLADLSLMVSTGRVVDFRATGLLRREQAADTIPLIYPHHFRGGYVRHPAPHSKKSNWIIDAHDSAGLLVPSGVYVIVKRFSSKEEQRRIVAAIYDPERRLAPRVGFENHLNYFHEAGHGLTYDLARGLATFLNSSLVDAYFRQFNGHTQVNAADLRSLRYPTRAELETLGAIVGSDSLDQNALDQLIATQLLHMNIEMSDPITAKKRIDEAARVLKALGFPSAQQNERSALTLLSLLDLRPETSWAEASAPLRGVTQMMYFFAEHYSKQYKPNTRESVRRQTVHQFLDAGLIVANPDKPSRPINSGKTVYQIEDAALEVLRSYGTSEWDEKLRTYLAGVKTLQEKYAQARKMSRIPVTMPSGQSFTLSAGGQNVLIAKIIEDFCPHFTPGGKVLYVGDADEKWAIFDQEAFTELGVTFDAHGKMPDVVVYHVEKEWLVLIEAVTSHGPVNPKRREELKALFGGSNAGLVYVTAFLDRKTLSKYLGDISWETEVWVAEAATHMIHFNGERFLGTYES
jgi:adenine-specific DNA-methyltransferase